MTLECFSLDDSDSASEDRLPMVFLQSMALPVLPKQGLTRRCKCSLGINPYRCGKKALTFHSTFQGILRYSRDHKPHPEVFTEHKPGASEGGKHPRNGAWPEDGLRAQGAPRLLALQSEFLYHEHRAHSPDNWDPPALFFGIRALSKEIKNR